MLLGYQLQMIHYKIKRSMMIQTMNFQIKPEVDSNGNNAMGVDRIDSNFNILVNEIRWKI